MWQLGLLLGLILTTCCLATPQRSQNHLSLDEQKVLSKMLAREEEMYGGLTCGKRNIGHTYDSLTYTNEYPWIVNIMFENGRKRCDGSLIHPEAVLTAAHCVDGEDIASMTVFAGQRNRSHFSEYSDQYRLVWKIKIHKDFERQSRLQNFAILILLKPFDLTENVGVVCLLGLNPESYYPKYASAGWVHPKGAELNVEFDFIDRDVCRNKLEKISIFVQLDSKSQCSDITPRKLTCEDNFGFPLAVPLSSNYRHFFQRGLLSWNPYCFSSEGPTVWSMIKKEDRKWIANTLRNYNIS